MQPDRRKNPRLTCVGVGRKGLQKGGRALWRAMWSVFDFRAEPHLLAILEQACRTRDEIDRLEVEMDDQVVKEDRKLGMQSAADVGRCDLENENIIMAIWKDKGQKQNWIGMAEKIGCEMGKAFGVSSFDFVDSGRWTVSNTSETLAKKISDAIGGKATHVDCG